MSSFSARFDVPPVMAGVPVARHVTLELLHVWGAPHDRDDAGLLVSELVANVVDHVGGETSMTLEVSLAGAWLRISLADGSAIQPVVHELCEEGPRGRGMQLVEAIASRWGVEDHEGGKRIWFELESPLG